MSCAGKQVIHPGQIQAVQEEFSPSLERVQWAKELIAAFDQHQKEGKVMLLFSSKSNYFTFKNKSLAMNGYFLDNSQMCYLSI